MKKGKFIFLSLVALLTIGFSSLSLPRDVNLAQECLAEVVSTDDYYSSIKKEYTGSKLLLALQILNQTKLTKRIGYDKMPSYFHLTDPGDEEGTVRGFYSGESKVYKNNMNREHVWPASRMVGGRGKDPLEDDMHMVRPTLSSDNGSRSNSFYVEGMHSKSSGWDPINGGDETYRGDCARIIFYCVVADLNLSIVDKNNDSTSNHTMGKLSDLLKWNSQYAVSEREIVRNNEIEKLQGNRNPFIDHPEYIDLIWNPKPIPVENNGCGGSIASTSLIISIISLCGISIIAIKKIKFKTDVSNDKVN